MKRAGILYLILGIVLWSCSSGSGKNAENATKQYTEAGTTEISFNEYEHNFGKVKEGEKVAYIFSFENKGPGNLVIASASTSCGCTVPKYDTRPIPPGEGGSLEVVFDTSGRSGLQTKTISVRSNSKTPVVVLKITAEVITNNNN